MSNDTPSPSPSIDEAARAFSDAVTGARTAAGRVRDTRKAVEALGFHISEDDPRLITSRSDGNPLPERVEADVAELLGEATEQDDADIAAWAATRALQDAKVEIAAEEYRAALKALGEAQTAAARAYRRLIEASRGQLGKPAAAPTR